MKIDLMQIDFIRQRKYAFILSIFITISTLLLLLIKGINWGIDFSGGIVIEYRSENAINSSEFDTLRSNFQNHGYSNVSVQNISSSGNKEFILRIAPKNDKNYSNEIIKIKEIIFDVFSRDSNDGEFRKIDFVGPQVSRDLFEKAFISLFLAFISILVYIGRRFDWKLGIGAIIALMHDVFSTIGFYCLTQIEFDLSAIAVLLTIVGYSINDSVVIFDRIRENLKKLKHTIVGDSDNMRKAMNNVINTSICDTLSRTMMTTLTTLVACISLVILGGHVLRGLSSALTFGVVFGTYSSLYIATIPYTYRGCSKNL